jgi:hypothetical protein
MNSNPCVYTLYIERSLVATTSELYVAPNYCVHVRRNSGSSQLNAKNLEDLANEFVSKGWRITGEDTVQTITSIIQNQYAKKPWELEHKGLTERVTANPSSLVAYLGLSNQELLEFHTIYSLKILDKN